MTPEKYKLIAPKIPEDAGVYKLIGENQKILYIGKAKNIKKRVASYFMDGKSHTGRIRLLVKQTRDVEVVVVENEQDALLLENSLIKENQPKYNVQLKDDKSYPFICVKNERFPRIFLTRNRVKDGSLYLGPYSSVNNVKELLKLIRHLFPIRTCNFNLSTENIRKGKFKVCLEYHIENCLGPCEDLQEEEDYNLNIQKVLSILKGEVQPVIRHLEVEMDKSAVNYQFEKAQQIKVKIEKLKSFKAKSTIVNPQIDDIDVVSCAELDNSIFVHLMKIKNGTIIKNRTIEVKKGLEETKEELVSFTMNYLRIDGYEFSSEILSPFPLALANKEIKVTIPKIGDKKNLLELAYKNALFAKNEKIIRKKELKVSKVRDVEKLEKIKQDLRLTEHPFKIECIDISTFQGKETVGSVVVFENTKPARSEYRKFKIKSFEGSNDFQGIYEVVSRRYGRLIEEQKKLPQLIIIDGGKGQLNMAKKALEELGVYHEVALISIAKRLEEIYFPGDSLPLYINKKSETLRIIQQLRNEAHRFAITFHRDRRKKSTLKNELEQIKGIGPKTTENLLKKYKSLKKMRQVTLEELASLIGMEKAKLVSAYFNNSKDHVQSEKSQK